MSGSFTTPVRRNVNSYGKATVTQVTRTTVGRWIAGTLGSYGSACKRVPKGCCIWSPTSLDMTSDDLLDALSEAIERLPILEEAAEAKSLAVLRQFVRDQHSVVAIGAASHH
jgi:hypothetical protein